MNNYLDKIIGQEKASFALSKITESGSIPHAFLFKGPAGVGKEFAAILWAQELASKYSTAKNIDSIISNINQLNEPYIKYIYPLPRGKNEISSSGPFEKLTQDDLDTIKNEIERKSANPYYQLNIPKAKNIKISSIRDIKKFLSMSFDDSAHRIVLISDAHLMNEEAQNALLKNLEEPPQGVIFILCTAYPDMLRETIISRCWSINFNRLEEAELIQILLKYFEVDENLAREVVPFSEGSVKNAIELIDNDFLELKEKTIRILRYSFGKRYHSALQEFSETLDNQDQKQLKLLIKMILFWLNDLNRFRNEYSNFFFEDKLETIEKFNSKFPHAKIGTVANKIDSISSQLKFNLNLNLSVHNIIAELSTIIPR